MVARIRLLFCLAMAVAAGCAFAQDKAPRYPETRRDAVIDVQFGEAVADPYRWLENDVRTDPEVAGWVERQNRTTRAYLDSLPQRTWFASRIRQLLDYERFGLPQRAGNHYFYTRIAGLQNQPQLFVRRGLEGRPRLLIDANAWSGEGTRALADWEPSRNGRWLAFAVQENGSDWRTIRVLDVRTGASLADEVRWAKFTSIAWLGSRGFFYARFPAPREGEEFRSTNLGQAIWFHRIGTSQADDRLVYSTPDRPELRHGVEVTHDGRWIVITSSLGTDNRRAIHLLRRSGAGWSRPVALVAGLDHDWRLIDVLGQRLFFLTNLDAPHLRVVSFDLKQASPAPAEVIAERPVTLERARIVGDRLILSYIKDAASSAEVISLANGEVQQITLNAVGTAAGFAGRPGDPETFFSFVSFNRPEAVFRYDSRNGKTEPFAVPRLTFDPAAFQIEQRFFTSKDGTRVPMFLVRRKDLVGKAVPTLLYGYGGFEVAQTPTFSAARMAWLEAGGAFALANLRGGGEYGKEWHDAGRLANKQNVFDDFVAAGEYLIAQGITPRRGLAIQGRSNGGLLIGAVLNQRPDLFAAANPSVGVMDMLRFDRFTAGRYWVDDYGHPDREADFRVLRAYSPYHNIAAGRAYPPVLVTTADTDDRVVPGHSFKYAAALQAADPQGRPHLIRIETGAGHGSGKPTDKAVEEEADVMAFLAYWTGLAIPANTVQEKAH